MMSHDPANAPPLQARPHPRTRPRDWWRIITPSSPMLPGMYHSNSTRARIHARTRAHPHTRTPARTHLNHALSSLRNNFFVSSSSLAWLAGMHWVSRTLSLSLSLSLSLGMRWVSQTETRRRPTPSLTGMR